MPSLGREAGFVLAFAKLIPAKDLFEPESGIERLKWIPVAVDL